MSDTRRYSVAFDYEDGTTGRFSNLTDAEVTKLGVGQNWARIKRSVIEVEEPKIGVLLTAGEWTSILDILSNYSEVRGHADLVEKLAEQVNE